jgi:hypothetical protein
MEIMTKSGVEKGCKRSPYMKWLQGWKDAGAWTGWSTLEDAWQRAKANEKPSGCSWYAYGYLMAKGAYQTANDMENH